MHPRRITASSASPLSIRHTPRPQNPHMNALDPIPFDELPRGSSSHPARGARFIAEVLDDSGIDAASDLYDEALELAREGQLGKARDRLRMLLCLDPHDAQAHLLLAKVLGSQGRWPDALAELDASSACGLRLPPTLRESYEANRDAAARDTRSEKVAEASRAELHALREEARRLRAENTRLERGLREQTDRTRLWTSATAIVAGVGVIVLLAGAVFGDDSPEGAAEQPVAEAAEEIAVEVPPAVEEAAPIEEIVAPAPAGPRTYTVQKGDNLGGIARKTLGASSRWPELQAANQDVPGEGIDLQVGMDLIIPD